jgi:hypothetical protein
MQPAEIASFCERLSIHDFRAKRIFLQEVQTRFGSARPASKAAVILSCRL